jgi:hypothetical protein
MALDTTIGGASADSYGTLAAYQTYAVANIDRAFSGTDADQEVYLRRAAQIIDREYLFTGYRQYQTQALAWPRVTNILVDGWPVLVDTVPDRVIQAQFEIAYQIETDSLDPLKTVTGGAVKVAQAGSVMTEFATFREKPRIVAAEGLLRPLMQAGYGQMRLVRG